MKVLVLYHQQSDHLGLVEDFVRDFKRFKGKTLKKVSLETPEGDNLAKLYDVTQYPAFLATSDDGILQRMWQGIPMPLMDELEYYTKDQPMDDQFKLRPHQLLTIQPLHKLSPS